jgi:hypothetical protein
VPLFILVKNKKAACISALYQYIITNSVITYDIKSTLKNDF